LWRGEKVLILDEPTSMLTPQGVKDLGQVMTRLRDKGVALILITHKLAEAYEFGDRISVLRLGRVVGALPPQRLEAMNEAEVTDAVIRMMFGAPASMPRMRRSWSAAGGRRISARNVDRSGAPRLKIENLQTEATRGASPLRGASFDLWPGEVLGIAGIDGNGQKHLAEALAGAAAGRRRPHPAEGRGHQCRPSAAAPRARHPLCD
jgi:simple sugar transport system ATP-binding protein